MNILLIKTDQPQAELYICSTHAEVNKAVIASVKWEANRELSDTILIKIKELLEEQDLEWSDIKSVGVFEGPGSFTGLRIGVTVANTLSYALSVPVVGAQGESWQDQALEKLRNNQNDKIVKPFYGREARITTPKK